MNLTLQGSPATCNCPQGAQASQGRLTDFFIDGQFGSIQRRIFHILDDLIKEWFLKVFIKPGEKDCRILVNGDAITSEVASSDLSEGCPRIYFLEQMIINFLVFVVFDICFKKKYNGFNYYLKIKIVFY